MNVETTKRYIIETKKVPIKTNKTSSSEKHKLAEKIYTEGEVKEMIKEVLKEITNESNL